MRCAWPLPRRQCSQALPPLYTRPNEPVPSSCPSLTSSKGSILECVSAKFELRVLLLVILLESTLLPGACPATCVHRAKGPQVRTRARVPGREARQPGGP